MSKLGAKIKFNLGICNTKWCCKKAEYELNIPILGVKRNLCEKHMKETEELLNRVSESGKNYRENKDIMNEAKKLIKEFED